MSEEILSAKELQLQLQTICKELGENVTQTYLDIQNRDEKTMRWRRIGRVDLFRDVDFIKTIEQKWGGGTFRATLFDQDDKRITKVGNSYFASLVVKIDAPEQPIKTEEKPETDEIEEIRDIELKSVKALQLLNLRKQYAQSLQGNADDSTLKTLEKQLEALREEVRRESQGGEEKQRTMLDMWMQLSKDNTQNLAGANQQIQGLQVQMSQQMQTQMLAMISQQAEQNKLFLTMLTQRPQGGGLTEILPMLSQLFPQVLSLVNRPKDIETRELLNHILSHSQKETAIDKVLPQVVATMTQTFGSLQEKIVQNMLDQKSTPEEDPFAAKMQSILHFWKNITPDIMNIVNVFYKKESPSLPISSPQLPTNNAMQYIETQPGVTPPATAATPTDTDTQQLYAQILEFQKKIDSLDIEQASAQFKQQFPGLAQSIKENPVFRQQILWAVTPKMQNLVNKL